MNDENTTKQPEKLHTSVRLEDLIDDVRRAADREERTISQQIRHYIREGLRRDNRPRAARWAHALYEAAVSVDRGDPADRATIADAAPFTVPEGYAALLDAEASLLALVPDVVGLHSPDEPLPELLAALLNHAWDEAASKAHLLHEEGR